MKNYSYNTNLLISIAINVFIFIVVYTSIQNLFSTDPLPSAFDFILYLSPSLFIPINVLYFKYINDIKKLEENRKQDIYILQKNYEVLVKVKLGLDELLLKSLKLSGIAIVALFMFFYNIEHNKDKENKQLAKECLKIQKKEVIDEKSLSTKLCSTVLEKELITQGLIENDIENKIFQRVLAKNLFQYGIHLIIFLFTFTYIIIAGTMKVFQLVEERLENIINETLKFPETSLEEKYKEVLGRL